MQPSDLPARLFRPLATVKGMSLFGDWVSHDVTRIQTDRVCRDADYSAWHQHRPNLADEPRGGTVRCSPMPHWDAIVTEANHLGWPERFASDVYTHDRNALAQRDPSEPFVWSIHANGSTIGYSFRRMRLATATANAIRPDPCRHYVWDGRTLWPYAGNAEGADEFFAELYASRQ
jgi:hypothetical protein